MDQKILENWIANFQAMLLAEITERVPALSTRVREAFLATPRHVFLERYRCLAFADWQTVNASNLAHHLPMIYRDDGLGIFGEDLASTVTISTPSLVLEMLEWLQLEPGHRVFELGTGSGWNAALLGHLVGSNGYVESVEIIADLAHQAKATMRRIGRTQVQVRHGDATQGPSGTQAFDRAIYTAGAFDLPRVLYDRIRVGGLLIFVLRFPGGGEAMILLRREQDHFASIAAKRCSFVPVTGSSQTIDLRTRLRDFPPWRALSSHRVASRPFPLGDGGQSDRGMDFSSRSFSLRSYLSIVARDVRYFFDAEDLEDAATPWTGCTSFGLWDQPASSSNTKSGSLALVRKNVLESYGNDQAMQRLNEHLQQWFELGMPSAIAMSLRAYPQNQNQDQDQDQAPPTYKGEWVVNRPESRFVWSTLNLSNVTREP